MSQPKDSLRLADGTVLENSSCGFANRTIWCWISGKPMADCFSLFSDPEKTETISMKYQTTGYRYRGFTDMNVIRKNTDSVGREIIEVRLAVPDGGIYSIEEFTEPEEE